MPEIFKYGNQRNSFFVSVFHDFAHFVKRISVVFIEKLRIARANRVFEITKHRIVPVPKSKIDITFNKRYVFFLSCQIDLCADKFHVSSSDKIRGGLKLSPPA